MSIGNRHAVFMWNNERGNEEKAVRTSDIYIAVGYE